jgi:hypothetical protein
MNPLETIENDRMLQAILKGLTDMWHFPEDLLSIIVYHTKDFDIASATVDYFAEEDIELEEALFQAMSINDFKKDCSNSEYLNTERCKELLKDIDETT